MNPEHMKSLLTTFVPMMAEHKSDPDVVKILQAICTSDDFFMAAYSVNPKKTLTYEGSLAFATLHGYKSLRMLEKVAKAMYPNGDVSVDRLVLCLLLLMFGRFKTGRHRSMSTATVAAILTASDLEINLNPSEMHAITQSTDEFTVEWWILSQAIQAIEVENM